MCCAAANANAQISGSSGGNFWRRTKRPRRVHLLRETLNRAFDRLQAGFGLPGALTPAPVFGFELP